MNETNMKKEIINFILIILFTFIHVFYISPYLTRFFDGRFISLGLWLTIVGIWTSIVKMSIVKSFLLIQNYKVESGIYITVGSILMIIDIIKII